VFQHGRWNVELISWWKYTRSGGNAHVRYNFGKWKVEMNKLSQQLPVTWYATELVIYEKVKNSGESRYDSKRMKFKKK